MWLVLVGCKYPVATPFGPVSFSTRPSPASRAPAPTDPPTAPALVRDPSFERGAQARALTLDAVLTVLHVQVPADRREQVEPLWNHLREDVLGSATALRLRKNGLRVGIGNAEWWDAVKATLDAVEGVRCRNLDPVRLPPDFPLALELDEQPREQTLFYVADDGILTGETWPHSRNVLRVSYELNRLHPERVRLLVVPEVRQRLDGWRWVRGASGVTQEPQYSGRAFAAAAFAADLEPGEFLLVAPSREADVYGIVGGVFLSSAPDPDRYDTYVFLRADVNHVALRP
jgi:hypothetical protein